MATLYECDRCKKVEREDIEKIAELPKGWESVGFYTFCDTCYADFEDFVENFAKVETKKH